jgi:hypothetical protein
MVLEAVLAAARRTDPTSVVDRSRGTGGQGAAPHLASSIWEAFLIVASDAATGLFVDGDAERMDRLERRFWRLVEPAS